MANSLQKLKEILKEPLAISDAASVGIYHENWIPVTSEDHFSALLCPNITFYALTGNASLPQYYRYHQEVPPLRHLPPHQPPYDCRHGDRPLVITDIRGNASLAPNNPAPPPEMPPHQELRCQSRHFASPLSNLQSVLRVQSLAQQAHVRNRAPPPYHRYMYESSCGQAATHLLRCAHLPQYLQRSRDCTRHRVETQQPQPHRSIPPLYHVPSQRYFPSRVAPLIEAFPNQAHHQAPVLHLPTPLDGGGMPVNYQVRTLHASDAMCTPPTKAATLTASLQTTTTYSVALHAVPGVINLADTTRQHAAKAWNGGRVEGHCAEEVRSCDAEEWSLSIDPDPPALAITIPKDQCSVSVACSASEGNLHTHITACDTEEWSLSIDPDPPALAITIPKDQCSVSVACSASEVMVHTGSRLEDTPPHTASSNDQDMDHCKIETTVMPTTACEPLIAVPLSGDKVTEGGVLAKKLPFEDFCTELEVVSSVEKEMFDGSLFVKSEVDRLKEVPPIHCTWETDKKGSPCGVPEIEYATLDSGLGDHLIIKSLLKESSTLEERDNYFTSLCKDQISSETTSPFPSLCKDLVPLETAFTFTSLCKSSVPSETTSTCTFPSSCKDQVSSETISTVTLCQDPVTSETASTFTLCKHQFQAETTSTVHQTCPLIVKLPLKYFLERSSRKKRVRAQRKRIVRRVHQRGRGKQTKSLCVRIPLAKLNNMPQRARVQHASIPDFRKKIQVTSCTKIVPLKQLDVSKMELGGFEIAVKGNNCVFADTSSQIAQCRTSSTMEEQWNEVLEHCEQLGSHQREELMGIMTGRIKCDGATDSRRFVLKSLPEGQFVCLEVDLKSRTWSPFKINATEMHTTLHS